MQIVGVIHSFLPSKKLIFLSFTNFPLFLSFHNLNGSLNVCLSRRAGRNLMKKLLSVLWATKVGKINVSIVFTLFTFLCLTPVKGM